MMRRLGVIFTAVILGVALNAPAYGQAPKPEETKPAETKPEDKKEEKPKTLWEEHVLFAYIENSLVWNLSRSGRDHTNNELRVFDNEDGYTFNAAEFSLKKDPSEKYPFGYGVALTTGIDAQKIHALGMFRGDNDTYPFRKAGKFVTLLGYEVIEGPLNPNFSRSFMFGFAIPFIHVGGLLSYSPLEWLTIKI